MSQLAIGIPVDNPVADDSLVIGPSATTPRQYTVRLTVASEANVWVSLLHRASGGGVRSTMLIPITGPLLGPVNIYTTYFHQGDYVEVMIRSGVPTVAGTVQATVELI